MFFRHISFRKKIFIIIFTAILIPSITVSSVMYIKAKNAITEQTERTVTNSMSFVIGNIDSSLKAINEMSNTVLTDTRLTSVVSTRNGDTGRSKAEKYAGVFDLLRFFTNRIRNTFMLSGIDSYYLYIPEQKTLIDSKSTYYENVMPADINFVRSLKNGDNATSNWYMTLPYEEGITGFSRLLGDRLITCTRTLKGSKDDIRAYLAINVDTTFISDNFNKIATGTPGEILAIDNMGKLVAHSDNELFSPNVDLYDQINKKIKSVGSSAGSFFMDIDGSNHFVIYSISDYTNWRYIEIIPAAQVLGQVLAMKNFMIAVISIVILLVLGITYLLSSIFYKPLEKLVSAMQELENRNLTVRIDDNRGDEYHRVYSGFNNMVTELDSLVKDLVNEKLLNKEAQIKLLQAQINPHFLYNTLESINSIAKIKKVEEISAMVTALSKFFRISLNAGRDMVKLKDALELAVNYLTIQNIRFNGKIEYEIIVPEEYLDLIVPKLILQPIVENSVYHGIERQKGKGRVNISGKVENERLILSVEDNGLGIDEMELLELKGSLENDNYMGSKNFALRNLNRQIKLKFGQEYSVDIESRQGDGTRVLVSLPVIVEGSDLIAT